ncbi:MAG: hypothetical protein QM737_21925 [Ferruginibacter sp.]
MKVKLFNFAVVMILVLAIMSFSNFKKGNAVAAGVYGVCDEGDCNSNHLKLTLNSDHTFKYINKTHSTGTINISGTWEQDGNKILLKNFDKRSVLKDKWVLIADEKCIRSRKGLEWTRLCLLKQCK